MSAYPPAPPIARLAADRTSACPARQTVRPRQDYQGWYSSSSSWKGRSSKYLPRSTRKALSEHRDSRSTSIADGMKSLAEAVAASVKTAIIPDQARYHRSPRDLGAFPQIRRPAWKLREHPCRLQEPFRSITPVPAQKPRKRYRVRAHFGPTTRRAVWIPTFDQFQSFGDPCCSCSAKGHRSRSAALKPVAVMARFISVPSAGPARDWLRTQSRKSKRRYARIGMEAIWRNRSREFFPAFIVIDRQRQ